MTKSKFDFLSVFLLLFATLCGTGLLTWTTYDWFSSDKSLGLFQRILFTTISAIVTPLFIGLEFPKLESLEIDDKKIILKNLLTGTRKVILIEEIDGFKTTSKWSKGGLFYEVVIIVKGKPFHKISSNYIKNYDKIRTELTKRLTLLFIDAPEDMRHFVKQRFRN